MGNSIPKIMLVICLCITSPMASFCQQEERVLPPAPFENSDPFEHKKSDDKYDDEIFYDSTKSNAPTFFNFENNSEIIITPPTQGDPSPDAPIDDGVVYLISFAMLFIFRRELKLKQLIKFVHFNKFI